MDNRIMLGMWRYMLNVPPFLMAKQREKGRKKMLANLAFMTPEHRRVHHYAVRELPVAGKPLPAAVIAGSTGMEEARVVKILDDLQEHMTFLFRNPEGEVIWAYPVTVEKTLHRITFSTGEQIYAA